MKAEGYLTLSIHWHVQVANLAIDSKDFSQMLFIDIFRELLNDNLQHVSDILRAMIRARLCASDRAWAPSATGAATLAPVSAIPARAAALRTWRDCATGS